MHMHPPKAHTLKHTILWLGQTHQSLSEQQIHIHTYTNIYTQTLSQAKLDMAGVLSMFRDVIHLLRVIVEPDKSWLDTKRLQPSFFWTDFIFLCSVQHCHICMVMYGEDDVFELYCAYVFDFVFGVQSSMSMCVWCIPAYLCLLKTLWSLRGCVHNFLTLCMR